VTWDPVTYNLLHPSLIILITISGFRLQGENPNSPAIKLLLGRQLLGPRTVHLPGHQYSGEGRQSCSLCFEFDVVPLEKLLPWNVERHCNKAQVSTSDTACSRLLIEYMKA
jgi:hypothetical protein